MDEKRLADFVEILRNEALSHSGTREDMARALRQFESEAIETAVTEATAMCRGKYGIIDDENDDLRAKLEAAEAAPIRLGFFSDASGLVDIVALDEDGDPADIVVHADGLLEYVNAAEQRLEAAEARVKVARCQRNEALRLLNTAKHNRKNWYGLEAGGQAAQRWFDAVDVTLATLDARPERPDYTALVWQWGREYGLSRRLSCENTRRLLVLLGLAAPSPMDEAKDARPEQEPGGGGAEAAPEDVGGDHAGRMPIIDTFAEAVRAEPAPDADAGEGEECSACGGEGWVPVDLMEHAPGCDGESCAHCPVPVEWQDQCGECGGSGWEPADAGEGEGS